jgi:hypothetical protein
VFFRADNNFSALVGILNGVIDQVVDDFNDADAIDCYRRQLSRKLEFEFPAVDLSPQK